MTRGIRRLILYTLIILFLITGPFLIAYSLGYSLNIREGTVERTGGIFVKSSTPRVAIFLNGSLAKETTFLSGSAFLTEIPPGTHLLRVEKQGFAPWSKTVEVTAQMVTEYHNVVLVPRILVAATTTLRETEVITAAHTDISEPVISETAGSSPSSQSAPSAFRLDSKKSLILNTSSGTTVIARNVHSFKPIRDQIYFIDQNGFLDRYTQSNGAIEILGHPGFYLEKEPTQFIASPTGAIAILDSAGGLFLLTEDHQLTPVTGSVSAVHFTPDGQKALLVKPDALEVIWMTENKYQPFQKKGMREIIWNRPEGIKEARWYYADTDHVLARTLEGIFFIEADGRGGRNMTHVVEGLTETLFTTEDIPAAFFYQKAKRWFKVDLAQ